MIEESPKQGKFIRVTENFGLSHEKKDYSIGVGLYTAVVIDQNSRIYLRVLRGAQTG